MQVDISKKKEQAQKILDRTEEINRTTKNFKQYFLDMIMMLDTMYKQQIKSTKQYIGSIIYEDKENIAIQIGNLQKFFTEMINQSSNKLNDLDNSDFNLENIKKIKKNIIENAKNSQKKLEKCYDDCTKNQQKYEKQSNEFKDKYAEYQQAQKTGYNIALSQKQEQKIKSFISEIESQEQILQQSIARMNESLQNYSTALKDNFNSMKILFSQSVESVLQLIKQFAIIHHKITEYVIKSIETQYLPPFTQAAQASKLQLQPSPQTSFNEFSQEQSEASNQQNAQFSSDQNLQSSDQTSSSNRNSLNSTIQSSNTLSQNDKSKALQFSSINFVKSIELLLEKFEVSSQNQSEESIRMYYYDQAVSIIEKVKKIIEDRAKNSKNLKAYITELNESYDFISKGLVKHMANRSRTSDSALSQKYTEVLNVFHYIIEGFSESFKQLTNSTINKGNGLNSIINEYSNMDKALQFLLQRLKNSHQQNENGLILQNEYSLLVQSTIQNVKKQESVHSNVIYAIIQSLYTEILKSQQYNQQFLQKAIDNVMITEDEVQHQIKAYFTKDEQMFDVQEKKLKREDSTDSQSNNNDQFVFKKLFILPEEFQKEFIEEQQKKQEEFNFFASPLNSKIEDQIKISDSLIKKFNVPQNDFVVDSFSCSYSHKISLRGTIYIFNTMVCFHSSFNSRTLLGDTVLVIPYQEIEQIDKKSKALIFDNAIQITTKKGTLTFTSFMSRDRCYRLIKQQMEQYKSMKDQKTRQQKKSRKSSADSSESEDSEDDVQNEQDEQNTDEILEDTVDDQDKSEIAVEEQSIQQEFPPIIQDEYKQRMDQRKQRILSANPKNYLTTEAEKHEISLENTHVREVFIEIFGDQTYKEFSSFNHFYQQTHILDTNLESTKWNPAPPSIFQDLTSNNYDEFLSYPDSSTKTSQFTHLVREKIGPKTCQVNSDENVLWLSHDEVLIQKEFKVSKVPMADCFTQQNFYHLQQTGPTSVKITFGFFINFVKGSMFKSMIRNSSSSENRDTWNNKFKVAIIDRIQAVQQNRNQQQQQKKLKGGAGNKKPIKISKTERFITQNQQSIETLASINKEINTLDINVDQYNKKQENLTSQQRTFFYLLIAIVAINFISLFK